MSFIKGIKLEISKMVKNKITYLRYKSITFVWLIAQQEEIKTNYWYNFRHWRQHKEKLGLYNGQMDGTCMFLECCHANNIQNSWGDDEVTFISWKKKDVLK